TKARRWRSSGRTGRARARSSTPWRGSMGPRASRSCSKAAPWAARRPMRWCARGLRWCPRGGGCSPRSRWKKTFLRSEEHTSELHDALPIYEGEAVAIIGANGAGKSSFLNALAGLNGAKGEQIVLEGSPVGGTPAYEMVRKGVALVPEGRRLFSSLSVEENLL